MKSIKSNVVFRIWLIIFSIVLTTSVVGITPPVNYWGLVEIDGNPAPDGTLIELFIDGQLAGSSVTQLQRGYYEIRITVDDPITDETEGFKTGDKISAYVDGRLSDEPVPEAVGLAPSGYSLELSITSSSGSDYREAPDLDSGDTGGGGSLVIPDSPINIGPIPPVAYWGVVLINSSFAEDLVSISAWGDCFSEGYGKIVQTTTCLDRGYYELKIPIDSPGTSDDEGCDKGDIIDFYIDGELVSFPENGNVELDSSGTSRQLDLSIGSAIPPSDEIIDILGLESKPLKNDMLNQTKNISEEIPSGETGNENGKISILIFILTIVILLSIKLLIKGEKQK